MLLQESIQELGSGIIDILDNKIRLTGFMSSERLVDYYLYDHDCRFSVGVYPKEKFDIAYIRDNALFIILENGVEITRYQFIPIDKYKKYDLKYKDIDNKPKSKVITIRRCSYTSKYNYVDTLESIIFDTMEELMTYLKKEYDHDLIL